MKLKHLILGAIALSLGSSAFADVTVNITGATAFRAATLDAIKAKFVASGAAFKFAHDQATSGGTTYNGATRSIWIGTFPGVAGTTTIRTCFTGSVEGIRALVGAVDPVPPTYYQPSLLDGTTAVVGGAELANQGTTGAATATSDIAFSDVTKSSTPYASESLLPASPAAGVIVFTMLTNEGSPITNVTAQQFRALMGRGFQPLSLFTGNATDTSLVFATGRNDGSGTRTTYLAETGAGITNPVHQYVPVHTDTTSILALQEVPTGGTNDTDSGTAGIQLPAGSDIDTYNIANPGVVVAKQNVKNASTVWSQDVDGNGGYDSGSALRGDMGRTSASVVVFDATGTYFDTAAGIPVNLVTWLSVNDAVTARTNGAIFCAYNGVKLDGIAASGTTMTAADKAKVTEGSYTAWGFENMYRRAALTSGDAVTVFDGIKAAIPTNLASAGIALTDMHVGRAFDGGTVAP